MNIENFLRVKKNGWILVVLVLTCLAIAFVPVYYFPMNLLTQFISLIGAVGAVFFQWLVFKWFLINYCN